MNFIANESATKLRGGYYTPSDLAAFLARWVAGAGARDVLEPSCGDGAFITALAETPVFRGNLTCFELDAVEAAKAMQRASASGLATDLRREDFLSWALRQMDDGGQRFDAVVGNPPFVRYQYLPDWFQERAERIFAGLGCRFTKHTNAWVPFILASMALLRPGGRLAMVVPSEIIHVLHAQSLRTYLGQQCRRLVIVDPREIWFEGTLQGAVMLMAEKRRTKTQHLDGLAIHPVQGRAFARLDPEQVFNAPAAINGRTVEGKWTRALLSPAALALLEGAEASPAVSRFADVAAVDVGIVTGANAFFLVDDRTVRERGLQAFAHPMFGRSSHSPGILYDDAQHTENARQGHPTNFIWLAGPRVKEHAGARAYIAIGERQELHTRFKCRVRSPWYTVPSVHASEVGMLKRSHDAPRLILNRAGAYTTDTAYRVRTRRGAASALVTGFLNPMTALTAELEGRTYGGGVLELVPSEIERLLVPVPAAEPADVEALDRTFRTTSMEAVLAGHGVAVLRSCGLGRADALTLLAEWSALRNRRQRIPCEGGPDEA